MSDSNAFSYREVVFCEAKCVYGTRSVQVLLPLHDLKVETTPIPNDANKPRPFNVVTLVKNFVVCEMKSDEKKEWTTNYDPFELRVAYSEDDWNRSKENGHDRPWLALWNEHGGWEIIDTDIIESIVGEEKKGGFLVAQIHDWEDPPIGIV